MLSRLSALPRTAWSRLFLDRQAAFWLAELSPTLAPGERRARVVEVIDETADTKTFVLAPGRRWPGHRAGQFVPVEVEIAGVRVRRCYSISSGASAPGAATIAITVRAVPGGRVSPWLHANLRRGSIVGLGDPAGEFVAAPSSGPLLLVGGGSGITPILAIVRDLAARDALGDVVVVHAARAADDAIGAAVLAALEASHLGLRVIAHRDAMEGTLDAAALLAHVPDLAIRTAYACGPAGLVALVAAAGPAALHVERFVAAPPPRLQDPAAPVSIRLSRSRRDITAAGRGSLLEQLERAGETPKHGCRLGVCQSCRCRKVSGIVEDAVTGARSDAPDEDIRLCVSIARSNLELAL